MPSPDPGLAAAGLIVGLLVGLTGMGGGSLMAPILILIVGVRPLNVVGTDLVYAAVAKVFGAWQHHRLGHVDYRIVGAMAIGSVPDSLLGVGLILRARKQLGPGVDNLIVHVLGAVLILVALSMAIRTLAHQMATEPPFAASLRQRPLLLPVAGALIGLLVGMTSVGSGTLVVAFLSLFAALSARRLVGTDVAHGALLSGAAALAHGVAGNVDPAITGSLLVGAVPGVLFGSRATGFMPERATSSLVAAVLFIAGVKLI